MLEEELEELLNNNKSLRLVYLDKSILDPVQLEVKKYIGHIKEYAIAEAFSAERFYEIEHLLFCNFLMNILNMHCSFNISRVTQFDPMLYYAELVSGTALVLKFTNSGYAEVKTIPIDKISNALEILTFPYKYLHVLYKRDRLAADRLLRKFLENTELNRLANPDYSKKKDFIDKVKEAITKLRKTPTGKYDKSKVSRELGIKISTFNDILKQLNIEYNKKTRSFRDLDSNEQF